MWSENDKALELVVRLIGLTNRKKIKWERASPEPEKMPRDRYYRKDVYVAKIDNDIFRLSEFDHREPLGEEGSFWATDVELEIIDNGGRTLWVCPPNLAIRDLFELAAEATTDIDGVMARLDVFAKAS